MNLNRYRDGDRRTDGRCEIDSDVTVKLLVKHLRLGLQVLRGLRVRVTVTGRTNPLVSVTGHGIQSFPTQGNPKCRATVTQ